MTTNLKNICSKNGALTVTTLPLESPQTKPRNLTILWVEALILTQVLTRTSVKLHNSKFSIFGGSIKHYDIEVIGITVIL